jgi:hypothetical protein
VNKKTHADHQVEALAGDHAQTGFAVSVGPGFDFDVLNPKFIGRPHHAAIGRIVERLIPFAANIEHHPDFHLRECRQTYHPDQHHN